MNRSPSGARQGHPEPEGKMRSYVAAEFEIIPESAAPGPRRHISTPDTYVGIGPQCLRDHRNQAMDPTAEINRPRRHQYPQLAAKAYHDARRSAVNTTESVLASTPSGT